MQRQAQQITLTCEDEVNASYATQPDFLVNHTVYKINPATLFLFLFSVFTVVVCIAHLLFRVFRVTSQATRQVFLGCNLEAEEEMI